MLRVGGELGVGKVYLGTGVLKKRQGEMPGTWRRRMSGGKLKITP